MIASEVLKSKRHISQNPNLAGHHTFVECEYSELIHWANQFGLPIFVTDSGWSTTYTELYIDRYISVTLKSK